MEIETYPEPSNITLVHTASRSLILHWSPYKEAARFIIEYSIVPYDIYSSTILINSVNYTEESLPSERILVENLLPKTKYMFRITLNFPKRNDSYIWPPDGRFIFETLPDVPSSPGRPIVRAVKGDVYKVTWEPAVDNGAPIIEYVLEALRYHSRIRRSVQFTSADEEPASLPSKTMTIQKTLTAEEREPLADEWTVYYNGTDNYWIVKDLTPISEYSFKVRARNALGWGNYSDMNEIISDQAYAAERQGYVLLVVVAPIMLVMLVVFAACIVCGKRQG